ncbi:HNH endonuclease [Priestia flexa]|uniref:HNH endonuclease n=1 Tax=Priestia flexa TaxID=86664 RepID=UPI000C2302D8|nr:HNH endonuclease [Priestia flexa]MEC0668216.1 HNH endonuclease [Priestia flexa]MED3824042.1 HNH endonuclease [Priestia flexa]
MSKIQIKGSELDALANELANAESQASTAARSLVWHISSLTVGITEASTAEIETLKDELEHSIKQYSNHLDELQAYVRYTKEKMEEAELKIMAQLSLLGGESINMYTLQKIFGENHFANSNKLSVIGSPLVSSMLLLSLLPSFKDTVVHRGKNNQLHNVRVDYNSNSILHSTRNTLHPKVVQNWMGYTYETVKNGALAWSIMAQKEYIKIKNNTLPVAPLMNNNFSFAQKRMQAAFQDMKNIMGRGKQAFGILQTTVNLISTQEDEDVKHVTSTSNSAKPSVWSQIRNGAWDGAKEAVHDTVDGAKTFVAHPIKTTVATGESIANVARHPVIASKSAWETIDEQIINGDAYSRSHFGSYASLQLVGAKGASAVVKGGLKQAAKSEAAAAVKKATLTGTKYTKTKVQVGYQSLTQQRLNYEVAGIGKINIPSLQHVETPDAKNQMYQAAPYTYTDLHTGEEKTVSLRMGHKKSDVHPITGVPYDSDGFPIFDFKFQTHIDPSFYLRNDTAQFKEAARLLYEETKKDPVLASKFTEGEIQMFGKGIKPKGYTWHHHQDEGKMQLVDEFIHSKTGHTGGRHIWGGGKEYR